MVNSEETVEQTVATEVAETELMEEPDNEVQKLKESLIQEVENGVVEENGKENNNGTAEENGDNVSEEIAEEQNGAEVGEEPEASTSAEKMEEDNAEVVEAPKNGKEKQNGEKRDIECINLDEEEVKEIEEPPAKKAKAEDVAEVIPEKETKKETEKTEKKDELTSAAALQEKLLEYIDEAIETKANTQRKVLDALLGAINVQVQREPLSVRKLILDKQLVLPNTISFPPSQVVDLLIEHDPDAPLSKVINKMFGDERPKLNEAERKERALIKSNFQVPHMTKMLVDIGQDLVQESTYSDIVHARNLPETPKNLDTYKQVASQLKPVWEQLKKKNEPYKQHLLSCAICDFKTESLMVLNDHKACVHQAKLGRYQCAICNEFDTNEQKIITHYLLKHKVIAKKCEVEVKIGCWICEEEFPLKGLRDAHFKQCKKDYSKVRNIMAPKDDHLHINKWLWDKPPVDPTILHQQQQAQQQQLQKKQAAMIAAQQAQLTAMRRQQANNVSSALYQQQLLQQQNSSRIRQMALMGKNPAFNNQMFLSAMQQLSKRGQLPAQLTAYQKHMLQSANNALKGTGIGSGTAVNLSAATAKAKATPSTSTVKAALSGSGSPCEICDQTMENKDKYLGHLQAIHKQMVGKSSTEMSQGAPLACSRCRDRFWTYEGLERHLVMSHGLVTADLLQKAQKKQDGGRCKLCGKQYAFNILQHLVADHQVKLCSAEIMYSCDVCAFKCASYNILEEHLTTNHPKNGAEKTAAGKKDEPITLDD